MSRLDDILETLVPVPYPKQNMGLLPDESTELDDERYDANADASMMRDEAKQQIKDLILSQEWFYHDPDELGKDAFKRLTQDEVDDL